MRHYLLVGGNHDGLNFPVADGKDETRIPVGGGGRETYIRDSLSVGAASVTIYRHESLTSEQVLNRLVEHYKAWLVNRPGGRH